ncbi:viperin family antiviral radical SAM protein [Isoptericola rhizosphaerae]|uniref:viperin family antiviral radical SAM protein n=1 Tax=Isoptericola rhizosphaerae TaxID=3377837 RepID=UPI00383A487E
MSSLPAPARRRLTANFHFIKSCNFRCDYCYATFADLVGRPVLPDEQLFELTRRLARRHTKVTLVGGEPTLYRRLPDLLGAVKAEGALTNLVTNGSRIDVAWLQANAANLDFLTISIDSASADIQHLLGRAAHGGKTLSVEHYTTLADEARRRGIVVKLNTVVTTRNQRDDMADLVRRLAPERWKLLQAAPVEGQNDRFIADLTPTRDEFDEYVARHRDALTESEIRVVDEPIDMIRGSYIMVDPLGRFFDSADGTHRYSDPILDVGIDAAFAQVEFDPDKFHARAGDADYAARPDDTVGGVRVGERASTTTSPAALELARYTLEGR